MNLEMKKVYVDTRFRTSNSKSESDFSIELPRAFNVPDGVVAHIDDIVIPVSWPTIDARNNVIYTELTCGGQKTEDVYTFNTQNYDGFEFAKTLNDILTAVAKDFKPQPVFNVSYVLADNILSITQTDARAIKDKIDTPILLRILTDYELRNGPHKLSDTPTINTIIRNTSSTVITELKPYVCY